MNIRYNIKLHDTNGYVFCEGWGDCPSEGSEQIMHIADKELGMRSFEVIVKEIPSNKPEE